MDWIIQYDPPDDPKEYIHRVGRTARGTDGKGRALLFLIPEELSFLKYLKSAKVPLNEYEFPTKKIANVQSQLEKLVEKNYYLHTSARDAYRAYILAYNSHTLKDVYNVHALDLNAVASRSGSTNLPRSNSTWTPRRAKGARNHEATAVREAITVARKAPVTILARKIHTVKRIRAIRVNSYACSSPRITSDQRHQSLSIHRSRFTNSLIHRFQHDGRRAPLSRPRLHARLRRGFPLLRHRRRQRIACSRARAPIVSPHPLPRARVDRPSARARARPFARFVGSRLDPPRSRARARSRRPRRVAHLRTLSRRSRRNTSPPPRRTAPPWRSPPARSTRSSWRGVAVWRRARRRDRVVTYLRTLLGSRTVDRRRGVVIESSRI